VAAAPRSEFSGPGWVLSLQRQRAAAEPGLSSNLGAAALAVLERRGPAARLAARLAGGEGLWLSVIAPPDVAVAARLPDGRALAGERLDDPPGPSAIHRFADAPLSCGDDPDSESLIVEIGACRLSIACLRAEAFDRLFGARPESEGEPAVYEGWRLP
jgi:hypothetical protein